VVQNGCRKGAQFILAISGGLPARRASRPVARTLPTTGILDPIMTSRNYEGILRR
jgi:hypothetical protein